MEKERTCVLGYEREMERVNDRVGSASVYEREMGREINREGENIHADRQTRSDFYKKPYNQIWSKQV